MELHNLRFKLISVTEKKFCQFAKLVSQKLNNISKKDNDYKGIFYINFLEKR